MLCQQSVLCVAELLPVTGLPCDLWTPSLIPGCPGVPGTGPLPGKLLRASGNEACRGHRLSFPFIARPGVEVLGPMVGVCAAS